MNRMEEIRARLAALSANIAMPKDHPWRELDTTIEDLQYLLDLCTRQAKVVEAADALNYAWTMTFGNSTVDVDSKAFSKLQGALAALKEQP